jgi:hypothetical protein
METAPNVSDPSSRLALLEKVPIPAKYMQVLEALEKPLIELDELKSIFD